MFAVHLQPRVEAPGSMISHCFIHLSSVHSLCFLAVCGGGSAGGPAGNLHITITERWFIIEDARHKGNDTSATEKQSNKTQARSTLESKAAQARRRSEISSNLTASAEEKIEGKEGRIYIYFFFLEESGGFKKPARG